MKKILMLSFFAISSLANADTRFLLNGSDGLNLAKVLLRQDTQKCLQEQGFKGVNVLTDARKAMIDVNGKSTSYIITIDQYKILPADGRTLAEVKDLTIVATEISTMTGTDLKISCSYETPLEF